MSLLYFSNNLDIFSKLIQLDEYNTNFMFYYIFDLLYTEKIIDQNIINILLDKLLRYVKDIKYINNNDFLYFSVMEVTHFIIALCNL
jgi:hypothetical protein